MKIHLTLLINGCRNGQDVVDSLVASTKRKEAKAKSTILSPGTHVFVLQALDVLRLILSINFNNMTRGKMIHLKPIHYDR